MNVSLIDPIEIQTHYLRHIPQFLLMFIFVFVFFVYAYSVNQSEIR